MTMNALTIKDPADLLSFIGHTLGFWPTESLVCITLDKDKVGATLRIDLPQQPGHEVHFAQTVAAYLTSDERANGIVFALYTNERPETGEARPHRATIAALTGVLAHEGITIRDGIYVTNTTYSPYDTPPGPDIAIPLSTTEYSQVNAEFIYRGSTIEPTNQITLPAATDKQEHATAVEHHKQTILSRPPANATHDGHQLWTTMLETKDYPTDDSVLKLIAYYQFPHIRDRLMADIPAIDEPPEGILFAHTYTRTAPEHRSSHPHHHRLHQLVGRQRIQSRPIPPTRPRHGPRLPLRTTQRPNARSRHHRRLEQQQKYGLQEQPRHALIDVIVVATNAGVDEDRSEYQGDH